MLPTIDGTPGASGVPSVREAGARRMPYARSRAVVPRRRCAPARGRRGAPEERPGVSARTAWTRSSQIRAPDAGSRASRGGSSRLSSSRAARQDRAPSACALPTSPKTAQPKRSMSSGSVSHTPPNPSTSMPAPSIHVHQVEHVIGTNVLISTSVAQARARHRRISRVWRPIGPAGPLTGPVGWVHWPPLPGPRSASRFVSRMARQRANVRPNSAPWQPTG